MADAFCRKHCSRCLSVSHQDLSSAQRHSQGLFPMTKDSKQKSHESGQRHQDSARTIKRGERQSKRDTRVRNGDVHIRRSLLPIHFAFQFVLTSAAAADDDSGIRRNALRKKPPLLPLFDVNAFACSLSMIYGLSITLITNASQLDK